MKRSFPALAACAIGMIANLQGDAAAGDLSLNAPLRSSPGLINETLRKRDERMGRWDLGLNARFRYEMHDRFAIAGSPGSFDFRENESDTRNGYLLTRVKPLVGYMGDWFRMFAEGRDSRAFDDDRTPSPEEDTFDLNQAFVALGNAESFSLSLQAGRQELSYGDERLVGPSGWHNIGRVFDAVKVRWAGSWFNADFFTSKVVLPDNNNFNAANDDEWFSGVYATTKKIPTQTTDLYFLARNTSGQSVNQPGSLVPGASPRDIYTAGLRVRSDPHHWAPWDYTAEVMGQFGRFSDPALPAPAQSLDHRAFAIAAGGGYTCAQASFTPRLGLDYSFASGDNNPNDGSHETFENLYPTNHKFYGLMDFVSLQNIHDLHLTASLKPLARVTLSADAHAFWLADTHDNFYTVGGGRRGSIGQTPGTGYGINPKYDRYVGSELDFVAGYAISPLASVEAGYGHFFTGKYIDQSLSEGSHDSSDANWFYLQLTLKF